MWEGVTVEVETHQHCRDTEALTARLVRKSVYESAFDRKVNQKTHTAVLSRVNSADGGVFFFFLFFLVRFLVLPLLFLNL